MAFYPEFSNKINEVLKKHTIQPAFTNNNKIKNLLGNTTDKDKPEDCSGIYKISCQNCRGIYIKPEDCSGIYKISCQNCRGIYIGQTKRNIKTKFREHFYYARRQLRNKSVISDHLIDSNHTIELENLNLIQKVNSR